MSGADNIQITVRERPLSTDINDLQSMQARVLSELVRYWTRYRVQGVPFTESNRRFAAGLAVTDSGSDVLVGVGVLGQNSATLVPTPGPLDSSFRLARLDTPVTIPGEAPVSDAWYLLEAQMVQVTATTVSRDVLDGGSGTFVPQNVPKQILRSIQFQLVAGAASLPLPTGGDWVPLAGIKWPSGGGAPLAIIDLRQLPDIDSDGTPLAGLIEQQRVETVSTTDIASDDVHVIARTRGPSGVLAGISNGAIDITDALYLEPGTVLSSGSFYYLYLASWSNQLIRPQAAQPPLGLFQGVLVLSATPPVAGTLTPSAAVTLPAPYAAWTVTSAAVCVGALRRETTGWRVSAEDRGQGMLTPLQVAAAAPAAVASVTQNVDLSSYVPAHARIARLRLRVQVSAITGSPLGATVQIGITSAVTPLDDTLRMGLVDMIEFDWPIRTLGSLLTYVYTLLPVATGTINHQLTVVGWRV